MNKIAAIALCLFGSLWPSEVGWSGFAIFQVATPSASVVCNAATGVATGVGAGTCATTPVTCDGNIAHDDAPAFATIANWAINTWQAAHTGQIEILLPTNGTCMFLASGTPGAPGYCTNGQPCPFKGIKTLLVQGSNTTMSDNSGAATISHASPAVVNKTAHGFSAGSQVQFSTLGTLPAPLVLNQVYFVIAAGLTANTFEISATMGGAAINTTTDAIGSIIASGQNGFFFGGDEPYLASSTSGARTQTVSAGATTITLVTSSDTSQFTVGNYALMQGIDLQSGGQPQAPGVWEFVLVTAKDGGCAGTGTVCISAPLKNAYKSTWPVWQPAVIYQGGPATLVPLSASWNFDHIYDGLILNEYFQISAIGRSATFRNFTALGNTCIFPTLNSYWAVINGNLSTCHMEVDKIVDTVEMRNVTVERLVFQNGFDKLFICDQCTFITSVGTPYKAVISNSSTVNFNVGAIGSGITNEVVASNFVITGAILGADTTTHEDVSAVPWTIASGTMTATNVNVHNSGYGVIPWGVPGANILWKLAGSAGGSYPVMQIGDATQTGASPPTNGNVSLPTSLSVSALPQNNVRAHPAPKFTCSACSGSFAAEGYANATAGLPMGSDFSHVYNASSQFPNTTNVTPVWGRLTAITITVNVAYGGTALSFSMNGPVVLNPDRTTFSAYNPTINAKVAGTRVITAGGVTCDTGSGPMAGGCSGDSISAPGDIWMIETQVFASFSSVPGDIAGTSVTLRIQADQGVVPQ